MLVSRNVFKCVASAERPKQRSLITNARKKFEKKRLETLKENINKLAFIATLDTKEITDFVKELDECHKEYFKSKKHDKTFKESSEDAENPFVDSE